MVTTLKKTNSIDEDISALANIQKKGLQSFLQQGLPTPKNENWKYTKIRDFDVNEFVISQNNTLQYPNCDDILNIDAYKIHFYNGKLVDKNLNIPAEIEILPLLDAIKNNKITKYINQTFDIDKFPFAALNSAYLEQGLFIKVNKNYQANKPIALVYHTSSEEKYFSNIHNVLYVDNNAKLELVEYYQCNNHNAKYFTNIVNECFVNKNASLNHYKVQNEAFKATHIALNCINVQYNGKYESFCLQKGAILARNETIVHLQEEKASACVNAAYTINGWASIDTTTNIKHLHQDTTSNQLIKGVIGGNARGVFRGKIHISPNAIQTQGYQLHKALILSDNAEIDVKPELEIFADDVKCSHGATCGELDKDQMFYLRSRGINENTAKELLISAFIEEPFNKIKNLEIKNLLKSLFI